MFPSVFVYSEINWFCLKSCVPIAADHGAKLHDVPDEYLVDTLLVAKKIAVAQGLEDYNILQVCHDLLPLWNSG